jgi:hypothetical protein
MAQSDNDLLQPQLTAQGIFNKILKKIKSAEDEELVVFEGLGRETALTIVESLEYKGNKLESYRHR